MFCPRDLPSLDEIRELTRDLLGAEAMPIFTVMRTLQVANSLAGAVESYLQNQFGVSTGRFSLLMILHRHRDLELTPSDLAERAAVTRATVTGLLDGLEKDGLVTRRSHSGDRRRVSLELTPVADAFIAQLIPEQAPRISGVANHLSETECRQFLRLLEKIEAGIAVLDVPEPGRALA